MAEINNFSEIAENFDTIKTLLNSIRAQGILNTSDVDKLLTGINSKLEKINTEEDIDLIKIFLSELKQNLDERHNVLISKFGAIESLFSNLLKNSSDALKSSEAKELFDIVATNLSVFSREVVSQKEALTDITLRLDAMRSDDSQKKDIIKSISVLKNDLDHLNNGFDSIVLSLNENFKTLIKTISSIDQSEAISKFGVELKDVVNSSNTILSALQMLDKKNNQIEDAMKTLATQEDVGSAKKWLSDLVTQNHELVSSIDNLSDKYYKIDNLAEKIDASVNIIAGLKTIIADNDDEHTKTILAELSKLENAVSDVSTNQSFEEFKSSLEVVLKDISDGSINLQNVLVDTKSEIEKINSELKTLDIAVSFENLKFDLNRTEQNLKTQINNATDKITQLSEAGITRALNDISSSADALSAKLKDAYSAVTGMCEKNFNDVINDISSLKSVVAQIDENNVSANNAIFSNITDRLALFENSLKKSLEKQEDYVANSSSQLVEQITNIKNLSGVLDYKLDSSVIEIENAKREFSELKTAVQDIIALDFVNAVKDLKVELYASKQDITNVLESSSNDLSEKFSEDLYGKYELLISKLDSVEEEMEKAQTSALSSLKPVLENISSSLVDILSYVAESKEVNLDDINIKLANITEFVKDSNINYIENIRDVVEVIRKQVENNLIQIQKDTAKQIDSVNGALTKNADAIREEIKYSYNKLLEMQEGFESLKESLNANNTVLNSNITDMTASAEDVKADFELKLTTLKNALLEKISDFKQEFTCENADKISEIKFASENLFAKMLQNSSETKDELRGEISQIIGNLKLNIQELTEQLAGTSLKLENSNESIDRNVDSIIGSVGKIDESLNKLSATSLAAILENFANLKNLINNLSEKSGTDLKQNVEKISSSIETLRRLIESVNTGISNDLIKQFGILESRFNTLASTIADNIEQGDSEINAKLSEGMNELSEKLSSQINDVVQGFSKIETGIADLSSASTKSMSAVLAQILDNFVALKSLVNNLNEKTAGDIKTSVEGLSAEFVDLKDRLETVDSNIDEDLTRQLSIIEHNFESLTAAIANLFARENAMLSSKLDSGFTNISSKMQAEIAEKLEQFKIKLEELFDKISGSNAQQAELIQERVLSLNKAFNDSLTAQNENASRALNDIAIGLRNILDENLEQSTEGYNNFKARLEAFVSNVEDANNNLISVAKSQLNEIINSSEKQFSALSSDLKAGMEENSSKISMSNDALANRIENMTSDILESNSGLVGKINEQIGNVTKLSEAQLDVFSSDLKAELEENSSRMAASNDALVNKIESLTTDLSSSNASLVDKINLQISDIAKLSEVHRNKIISGLNSKLEESTADTLASNRALVEKIENLAVNIDTNSDNSAKASEDRLNNFISVVNSKLGENASSILNDNNILKQKLDASVSDIAGANKEFADDIQTKLNDITKFVDSGLENQAQEVNAKFDEVSAKIQQISGNIIGLNNLTKEQLGTLNNTFNDYKQDVSASLNDTSALVINRIDEILKELTAKNDEISSSIILASADVKGDLKTSLTSDIHDVSTLIETKLSEIDELIENTAICQQNNILAPIKSLLDELQKVNKSLQEQIELLKQGLFSNISDEISGLQDRIQSMFEEHSMNFMTQITNTNTRVSEDLSSKFLEFKAEFEALNARLDKDEVSQMNVFQSQLKELSNTFNILIEEAKNVTKSEVSAISETLIQNSKALMDDVETSIESKVNSILAATADISAGELQTMEAFANKILKQIENSKQNSTACKDIITELAKKQFEILSENIEKETDVIVKDIIEQFELMRGGQKDELSNLTVHIESTIEDYIFNYVNELKSYLDVKTDSTVLNGKLDSLRNELNETAENVLNNMNKFLEAGVFTSSMEDLRRANEILTESMADRLNAQIQDFIKENVSNKFEERLNLFDKKFVDTVVDKYEEIKLISSQYNSGFEAVKNNIQDLLAQFTESKNAITEHLAFAVDNINSSIDRLNVNFADLRTQILNKSFDEAFQASLNNQISGIENLVKEQFGYLEDISELCCNNMPELTEMNTIVKYGIQQSISDLSSKLDDKGINVEKGLEKLKSDIITQFLNIFNQISFVAEQQEIIDFIQDKHSDLIKILSHIVTTVENVETIKDNVTVVDKKVDTIKDDIQNINKKISSIISSNGDIDYVYSLQDLESDIANLRLVLNEMKEDNKSQEFEELISSTNNIYKLVETIKAEMPKFELEEFKRDFDTLSEDIVSISTRTNKLILASDESYKTLQDNLQDFKLVINDLDERTRNFAHEAGIDRIDNKLGSINTMIQNGAKTNQVFNQVFEYLAEWVDKAGEQITTISDKVETLDDIGQIKVMLEDLKAEAEDNSESDELIEALGNVFDKQTKRISSLEAKLDRVIVETTINNKNNKIDMSPFETTLNRFLVAIDEKMSEQQDRINSLESKLAEVMTLIDPKDTAQLTKKVGGMDRQIAKLNKSIEKIASHVIEK